MMRDRIQICGGGPQADGWFEAAYDRGSAPQRVAGFVGTGGKPKALAKSVEAGRHYAYEGDGAAVQEKNLAEDLGIPCKLLLPKSVVHDHHRRSARLSIVWRKGSPQQCVDAEVVEGIGCHYSTERPISTGSAVVVENAYADIGNYVFEDLLLLATRTNLPRKEVVAVFPEEVRAFGQQNQVFEDVIAYVGET